MMCETALPIKTVTVGILEQNRLLRDSLTMLVRAKLQSNVVTAECLSDFAGLESLDLILVSIKALRGSVLQQLRRVAPSSKLVAINVEAETDELDLAVCVQMGIAGFIPQSADPKDVMVAIDAIIKGETFVPPEIAAALCRQLYTRGRERSDRALFRDLRITNRERQVIRLIAQGLTNKEIANELSISTFTVKSHIHNLLEKLEMRSRMDLMGYYWSDMSTRRDD